MQLFEALTSVETREIHGDTLGSQINPKKAYIITDDSNHVIYTFLGSEAGLVYRFLVDHLAKEIKSHMATLYQIEAMSQEIWSTLKEKTLDSVGNVPQIFNPDLYSINELTELLQKTSGVQLRIDTAWREHLQSEDLIIFHKVKPSEVLDLLDHQPQPPDLDKSDREMIVINTSVYSTQSSLISFLPKRKVVKERIKLGNIPEGRFFFANYTPRIFIQRGRVKAIELYNTSSLSPIEQRNKAKRNGPTSDGMINISVLPFDRIQIENDFQILLNAFHRPPKETLDEFLAAQKSSGPDSTS
ncbi:MAG: hypothetical protein K9W44_08910 [Candidatus Lokiarchaeota archaeon]|nr:hypothetical protein [Candidatus Harpocratesius repetitus]